MNEARAILADVVARLFTERVTRELRQSAETDVWPAALWAAVEPDRNPAREPRDTLVFDATPVAAAPAGVGVPPDAVWQYGALVRAAQIAGGVDAILRSATRYATERRQFGKPIGAYQAIQQNLAVLAGHAAAADIAAAHAFRAADRGDAAFEIGVAKVRAGEAAGISASIAHQVHGALGFTYEHDLQFVTRRLWAWRAEFGGEGWWASALGREVAGWGADALWSTEIGRASCRERV